MPENLSASSSSESDEESQRSSTDHESFNENRHDEENFGKVSKKCVLVRIFRIEISGPISPREGSRNERVHSSGKAPQIFFRLFSIRKIIGQSSEPIWKAKSTLTPPVVVPWNPRDHGGGGRGGGRGGRGRGRGRGGFKRPHNDHGGHGGKRPNYWHFLTAQDKNW